MSASLKLVSLNIERSKHLDLVIPFLVAQKPDVVCIQELFERDIPHISKALGGMAYVFAPMTRYVSEDPPAIMGVGVFSRLPFVRSEVLYYGGDPAHMPELDQNDTSTWNNKNFVLPVCEVENGGDLFRISTTHFRWTPDGKPDELQRGDMRALLAVLETVEEFVLTGDLNMPRGGGLFEMLAQRYKDNVPLRYDTSIDEKLHRNGPLKLMVDGIFSTPAYVVSDVEMISGVSDHCALVATLSKVD